MKKLIKLMLLLLIAATPILFTGCDTDDEDIAYTLDGGYWRGDLRIQVEQGDKEYKTVYSEISFQKDNWREGYGYWVDYYSDAPWDYLAYHFDWKVRDEVIKIHFREDNTSIEIREYRLSDNFFEGRIYVRGKYIDFKLQRRHGGKWGEDDYRWSDYYFEHNWDNDDEGYDRWNFSKSNGVETNQMPVRSLAVE